MNKLLTIKQVCELTGFAKATIYKYINTLNFPKPIKFNGRASRWIEQEIEDWLAKLIEERDRS